MHITTRSGFRVFVQIIETRQLLHHQARVVSEARIKLSYSLLNFRIQIILRNASRNDNLPLFKLPSLVIGNGQSTSQQSHHRQHNQTVNRQTTSERHYDSLEESSRTAPSSRPPMTNRSALAICTILYHRAPIAETKVHLWADNPVRNLKSRKLHNLKSPRTRPSAKVREVS
ncbi:AAEL013383-PA [Aedes aegypti]|uniref:AAEL013383-PA n=1 Tax=Aedes aegypti TaxID=7159 RepID=Q16JB9_AEDAE|nr:AAEL013383-PA [Aedes aegypti]